jgi:hypothetical protein
MTEETDPWVTLANRIGSYTAERIGRDHFDALLVLLDTRVQSCLVQVALHKNSREEQVRAMQGLLEVESVYMDDVTLSFDFVEDLFRDPGPLLDSQRRFLLA